MRLCRVGGGEGGLFVMQTENYKNTLLLLLLLLLVFIVGLYIAQSTAQGHRRAFHKFTFRTQVEYKTKYRCKIYKNNPKGSPFGIDLTYIVRNVDFDRRAVISTKDNTILATQNDEGCNK